MSWWVLATLGAWVAWRFGWQLPLPRWGRAVAALGVLGLALNYRILASLFGGMASPEVPRVVLLLANVGFISVLLLFAMLLVKDLLGVALWPAHKPAGRWLLRSKALLLGLGATALGLALLGVWQAVKVPNVNRIEITLPGLDPAFDGYRVAHLTDTHISRLLPGIWLTQVVARTNALNADAIVISGDLVDGSVAARANDYPPFAQLSAPDGVFAVSGNHEFYSGYVQWFSVFTQAGISMLENTHHVIWRDDAALVIAGVPDVIAPTSGIPGPDIAQALTGAPSQASIILLDHRPARVLHNQQFGVDLQLSGHTHGGHMLGFNRIVARFNQGFVSGLYQAGDAQLYVGNGAGLWPGFAVRLGVPSEITEITLRAGSALRH